MKPFRAIEAAFLFLVRVMDFLRVIGHSPGYFFSMSLAASSSKLWSERFILIPRIFKS